MTDKRSNDADFRIRHTPSILIPKFVSSRGCSANWRHAGTANVTLLTAVCRKMGY
jgi:hypothetical protein